LAVRDFQEINDLTNHRDAENTERGEIERIFAAVLEYFFIWKSLNKNEGEISPSTYFSLH